MTYGSETRPLLDDVGLKLKEQMQMIRWMCGVSMKDRRTSEYDQEGHGWRSGHGRT